MLTPAEQRRAAERGQALIGRPEQVRDGLHSMGKHLSPGGHLIARSYFPGLPWEVQRRQVLLLGEIAADLADVGDVS
jgi:alkanesulfonate monooxygenase SsuD/methylene tetrahydromethanopterin reductase-like flavin-dependent oxidoreductase (luciferase family)